MRLWRNEDGQVLVLTALSMSMLLGFVGFAADLGQLFHERRGLQAAVDSAVIAAAITYKAEFSGGASASNIAADMQTAATTALAENGISNVTVTSTYSNNVSTPTFFFSTPPADGPNAGSSGFMEGILTVPQPTVFMSLFGFGTMNLYTRAVAGIGVGNAEPCIYVLNKTVSGAMDLQGSFVLSAPGCGVEVGSNSNSALQFTGGSGTMTAGWIAVTGGDGGAIGDSSPTPITNTQTAVNDPFNDLQGPTPSNGGCSGSVDWQRSDGSSGTETGSTHTDTAAESSAKMITLTGPVTGPGTGNAICYDLPVTLSNVVLEPGIYVFEQGVTMNGSVTSDPTNEGVTLSVLSPGGLAITTGGASFGTQLTCPTSGSCAAVETLSKTDGIVAPTSGWTSGIAIMEPPDNTSQITLQFGNATGNITGYIYAPDAELYLQDSGGGLPGGVSFFGDLIVDTLYDKTTTTTLYSYASVYPASNPLKTVALVE